MENFKKCLEEFIAEAIINCPDSCFIETKDKEKLLITVPTDKLTEYLTNKFRELIVEVLESEKVKTVLKEKYIRDYKNDLQAFDLDGIVFSFER